MNVQYSLHILNMEALTLPTAEREVILLLITVIKTTYYIFEEPAIAIGEFVRRTELGLGWNHSVVSL